MGDFFSNRYLAPRYFAKRYWIFRVDIEEVDTSSLDVGSIDRTSLFSPARRIQVANNHVDRVSSWNSIKMTSASGAVERTNIVERIISRREDRDKVERSVAQVGRTSRTASSSTVAKNPAEIMVTKLNDASSFRISLDK